MNSKDYVEDLDAPYQVRFIQSTEIMKSIY